MRRLTAPFGITKVRKKIAYCNVNIIPRLKALGIKWDEYDTMRIRFCGRTFPMKYIDDGKCEEFIDSLIDDDGQTTLIMWER